MKSIAAILLLAVSAFAEPAGTPRSRSAAPSLDSISNSLGASYVGKTQGTGLQTYYVDPTGNDSNACTGTGTSACLTIQGAVNRVPKLLRDQVTIDVAAGTYAGFIVSGFSADNGIQQTTGGLLIDGKLANSTTLATGSATGTALGAGQVAGSGTNFGVICDSGATWTVNDLAGRFITTAAPTNTAFVISSNTATCATVVGPWNLPVSTQTTYAIKDPSVIVNSAVLIPGVSTFGETGVTGVFVAGNSISFANRALTISNMRIAPTSALMGLNVADNSSVYLKNLQIRPGGAFPAGLYLDYSAAGVPFVELSFCDISINSVSNGLHALSGGFSLSGSTLRNAQANGTAIQVGQGQGKSPVVMQLFTYNSITGFLNGIAMPFGTFSDDFNGIKGARITCGSSSGIAFQIGTSTSGTGRHNFVQVASAVLASCGTALQVTGPSTADVQSIGGSVATTGFDVRLGGTISYTKAATTITAGTNEINIDSGKQTALYADPAAGNCLSVIDTGSRACAR